MRDEGRWLRCKKRERAGFEDSLLKLRLRNSLARHSTLESPPALSLSPTPHCTTPMDFDNHPQETNSLADDLFGQPLVDEHGIPSATEPDGAAPAPLAVQQPIVEDHHDQDDDDDDDDAGGLFGSDDDEE